jgi:hypothetical protein
VLKVLAVADRPELWFGVTSPVEIHEADLLRWSCVVEAAKRIITGKVADKTDTKKASAAFSKLVRGEE